MRTRSTIVVGVSTALLWGSLATSQAAPAVPAPIVAPASNDAAARAMVAALPRATSLNDWDGNKIFDDLDAAFLKATPGERLSVIVSFRQAVSTRSGLRRVQDAVGDLQLQDRFRIIPAFAARLSVNDAVAVAKLEVVRQLELNAIGHPALETATKTMGADAVVDGLGISGSLDRSMRAISDADIGIAVIDTGIAPQHPDFGRGKLRAFADFIGRSKEPVDDNGHGTHVASIAAGWGGEDEKHRGVAPGAAIIALRIGNPGATTTGTIEAYEWMIKNRRRHNIRVANMSFGWPSNSDGTTALERAVDAAWDAGIVCFISAANNGPSLASVKSPATARGALAVGSILDPHGSNDPLLSRFGFALSSFSSRGPTLDGRVKPDLVAPGESIMAAGHTGGYTVKSGTSMAAPFAAGTAALMIAADPSLTPDEVREILAATTQDWGIKGKDNDYGWGRIEVLAAVRRALKDRGAVADIGPPLTPQHTIFEGKVSSPFITTQTFDVEDPRLPVAITVISDGRVVDLSVDGPDGHPVAPSVEGVVDPVLRTIPARERQASFTFQPTLPGTYTFKLVAAGATRITVDISHSTTRRAKVVRRSFE